MFSKSLLIMFIILFFSCTETQVDFKEGTFHFYFEDTLSRVIERKGNYQLEYTLDKQDSEIGFINWQDDNLYTLREIINSDSINPDKLFVRVDSIRSKTAYLNAYEKGLDYNMICKLVKVSDSISIEFKKLLTMNLPDEGSN